MAFDQLNSSGHLFHYIVSQLKPVIEENEAKSIAYLILEHEYGLSKTDVVINKTLNLQFSDFEALQAILHRLQRNEPVQYILGETEFYGLKLKVKPQVLIPRPETEELVDLIIKVNTSTNSLKVLDIGTGSGCIAIALKKHLKNAEVFAIDVSEGALEIARENALANHVEVQFIQLDILKNFPSLNHLDVVVSNPPYVLNSEKSLMLRNVIDHEPGKALFVPDNHPLLFYEQITKFATICLKKGGRLYFEINEKFGNEIYALLIESGFKQVAIKKDIHGKDRIATGIMPM